MTTKVVPYIIKHGVQSLQENYGIKIRSYPDRVVLNYCMVESGKYRHEELVKECRGLIICTKTFKVLCRSFDRFWNLAEDPNKDQFPINQAVVWEKLDGSIINVYKNTDDTWVPATRGMAFAEGTTTSGVHKFSDLVNMCFEKNLNDTFRKWETQGIINEDMTFIFELTSPHARVVKKYDKTELTLLAIRFRSNGHEFDASRVDYFAEKLGFKRPKRYLLTQEEMNNPTSATKSLPPTDEGYVCEYRTGHTTSWRVKVKNPSYLAIANLKMNGVMSEKRVALLVFKQDHEEYLSEFPEDQEYFDPYIDAFKKLHCEVDFLKDQTRHLFNDEGIVPPCSKKEFATSFFSGKRLSEYATSNIMFSLASGKNLSEIFENMNEGAIITLMDKLRPR